MPDPIHPIQSLKVSLNLEGNLLEVGRLALRQKHVYFEFDPQILEMGIEISPLKLKLREGLLSFDPHLFEGLPGVFYDSLPDGWGRLLLDRSLRSRGLVPEHLTSLDRLALVGKCGVGALVYEPEIEQEKSVLNLELDLLFRETSKILNQEDSDSIDLLLSLNGSSAGARPKIMVKVSQSRDELREPRSTHTDGFEDWMIKFPNTTDGSDAGAVEYVYSLMAARSGVEMAETHLFPSKNTPGYFGTKRFDTLHGRRRLHMHSVCGLLHADFRTPALDYEDIIKVTGYLTKSIPQAQEMYRRAVINVLAHNRDDHGKNFSFLMDFRGEWRLSPAYDLTFSSGPGGEQSTMIKGEAKNPGEKDLLALAPIADLSEKEAKEIIAITREALNSWTRLAIDHGVSKERISRIQKHINL